MAGGWRARWCRIRNRLLADPDFQRRASTVPGIRWVARRRARQAFDLAAGFVYSQILVAIVRLEVLEQLGAETFSVADLAMATGLNEEAARCLVAAAVPLRLLEQLPDGRIAAGDLGAALLGNPGALAMIRHHDLLYRDLADPVALLRGQTSTEMQALWSYSGRDQPQTVPIAQVAAYSALMATSNRLVSDAVIRLPALRSVRCLMDVGGGEGAFLKTLAAARPELDLVLFDLPAVADLARHSLGDTGLRQRISIRGGDFFKDPLPRGADAISLVRIIHDHDDGPARDLLKAVHEALPPGGLLVLAEPLAGAAGAESAGSYFSFYLLAMGSGRPRSASELRAMLEECGFVDITSHATAQPLQTGLLTAKRAG